MTNSLPSNIDECFTAVKDNESENIEKEWLRYKSEIGLGNDVATVPSILFFSRINTRYV